MKYLLRRAREILRQEGLIELCKSTSRYILSQILIPCAMLKIKDLNKKRLTTPEEVVNFAFKSCLGAIKPIQIRYEILELLKILYKEKPRVLLEIGTANGGTLFLFSRVASEEALLISVDLPGGGFGVGYPRFRIPLYESFAFKNQKIHLLRADSHSEETKESVEKILNSRKLDFLFIDGDHTYQGVKMDFEMYSPLVREGGLIALHDIVVHPEETGCGVHKFWNEIKPKYEHIEIVEDVRQKWAGIGVVRV